VIALAFKLPAEGSPVHGSTRVLTVDITPERVDDAVGALRELVGQLPDHPGILALTDISVADGRLVVVTPPIAGDALDTALQLYGPAAVDDALPRLRQLAGALDVAARAGLTHGALHPRDIVVSTDDTQIVGIGVADALARAGVVIPLDPRYAAPEVLESRVGTPAGDQFSLAVIAHEWMFGGAVSPADGFLAVPIITGVDVAAMQTTFDTASAPDPAERFGTSLEFCAALERSAGMTSLLDIEPAVSVTELPLRGDAGVAGSAAGFAGGAGSVFGSAPAPPQRQFGILALVATLFVGIALGAAAMRLLGWPSAPQSAIDASQGASSSPTAQAPQPTEVIDLPIAPPRDDLAAAAPPPPAETATPATTPAPRAVPDAVRTAQADAGLLIHSTPVGATVTIDGVERGTTPVAVRGLALGTRRVDVSAPGHLGASRQVTLTAERPSRTLDVELVAETRAESRPTPASPARVATSGSLVVDSRPDGALVTIDGRPSGSTPLTLTGLAPGRRTVRIERPGYRAVTTTVDVKAGERARVAARLEGGSNEE
jgi:hypothetical protein